ncbi:MAG: UbiA family prenyltransferase [Candidatus Nanohaloarchaea archaeon]|nr:UbiA family prenyltransferase [Candidatus Nanohaloarchaea archaeon]
MNLARFYRVPRWYHNMGMAVIGVLAAGVSRATLLPAAVGVLQVFLVQLHSFSMNDYYDHLFWGEDTYVGQLLAAGRSTWTLRGLMLAPLLAAVALYPVSGVYTVLIVLYAALFYLYQGPARLKRHWAFSIPLNAVPLGLIVFLHPYLVTAGGLGTRGIFFGVLFTCYMAFYEVAHQVEHQDVEDAVHSIVDAVGVERTLQLGAVFLAVPVATGIALALRSPLSPALAGIAAVFLVLRLHRLRTVTDYAVIRRSWHKFYAAHEGLAYVAVLALPLV